VVHGDRGSSRICSRCVDEIKLPPGATIGAVVRGEQVIMAHHDTRIEPGDHVIVFVASKRLVPQVEELFQVSASFL
jgi:trk system potassium uptake protein TrkA